jgi:hypothetical protein
MPESARNFVSAMGTFPQPNALVEGELFHVAVQSHRLDAFYARHSEMILHQL